MSSVPLIMFSDGGGPPARLGGPRGPGGPPPGRTSFLSSLYYDEFRFSVVKSAGFFLLGIYLAKEFKGVDLMGPPQPGTP